MCTTGTALAGFNTLASCPRQQLIVTNECVPISQACGARDVVYFTNPFANTVYDGLIQVNNTSKTCSMTVSVTDSRSLNVYPPIAPGAGIKIAVQDLAKVTVSCSGTSETGLCTGQLYLELHQCVTCF